MDASTPHGEFVWQDLMTNDVDGAIKFYTQVTGWKTMPWAENQQPYTMWAVGETPIGGVMANNPEAAGMPPMWLAYISTPDTDATVKRAVESGAKVHVEPRDIPTVGRFAVLQDPQGAAFAAFTPLKEQDMKAPAVSGFAWRELGTTDGGAAFDFYSKLFGWQKSDAMDMGPAGVYQMFGMGGAPVGGIYTKPANQGPPAWLNYISVDSVKAAEDRIKNAGGQVIQSPMEVPGGGWILVGTDPQGGTFAVHSPNA
jgi:uncharacterized protein